MKRFSIENTPIEGLCVIQRQPICDERGYLERFFCTEQLEEVIGKRGVVQANHTLTLKAGTVRGMHFQRPPFGEMIAVAAAAPDANVTDALVYPVPGFVIVTEDTEPFVTTTSVTA